MIHRPMSLAKPGGVPDGLGHIPLGERDRLAKGDVKGRFVIDFANAV